MIYAHSHETISIFLFSDELAEVTKEKPSRETQLQPTIITEGINIAFISVVLC